MARHCRGRVAQGRSQHVTRAASPRVPRWRTPRCARELPDFAASESETVVHRLRQRSHAAIACHRRTREASAQPRRHERQSSPRGGACAWSRAITSTETSIRRSARRLKSQKSNR